MKTAKPVLRRLASVHALNDGPVKTLEHRPAHRHAAHPGSRQHPFRRRCRHAPLQPGTGRTRSATCRSSSGMTTSSASTSMMRRTAPLLAAAEANGWMIVSMRYDWRQVFSFRDRRTVTGTLHDRSRIAPPARRILESVAAPISASTAGRPAGWSCCCMPMRTRPCPPAGHPARPAHAIAAFSSGMSPCATCRWARTTTGGSPSRRMTGGGSTAPATVPLEVLDPLCRAVSDRHWQRSAHCRRTGICARPAGHRDPTARTPGTPRASRHALSTTRSSTSCMSAASRATRRPASRNPGTWAGLIEKIPYLRDLGITHVQLLPVAAFDEQDVPASVADKESAQLLGLQPPFTVQPAPRLQPVSRPGQPDR
jgi:hypothetical protein